MKPDYEIPDAFTEDASGLTGAVNNWSDRQTNLVLAFEGRLIDSRFLLDKHVGSGGAGSSLSVY